MNKSTVNWSILFQTNLDGPFKRSGLEGWALEHVQNIEFLKCWYNSSTYLQCLYGGFLRWGIYNGKRLQKWMIWIDLRLLPWIGNFHSSKKHVVRFHSSPQHRQVSRIASKYGELSQKYHQVRLRKCPAWHRENWWFVGKQRQEMFMNRLVFTFVTYVSCKIVQQAGFDYWRVAPAQFRMAHSKTSNTVWFQTSLHRCHHAHSRLMDPGSTKW